MSGIIVRANQVEVIPTEIPSEILNILNSLKIKYPIQVNKVRALTNLAAFLAELNA